MAQGMTRRSVGRNNDGSEGVDKMQTLPRLRPASSCRRREQWIDGSQLSRGQRLLPTIIAFGSATPAGD